MSFITPDDTPGDVLLFILLTVVCVLALMVLPGSC